MQFFSPKQNWFDSSCSCWFNQIHSWSSINTCLCTNQTNQKLPKCSDLRNGAKNDWPHAGHAARPRRGHGGRAAQGVRAPHTAGHAHAGRTPHTARAAHASHGARTRRARAARPDTQGGSAGPRSAMRRRRSISTLYRSRRWPRRRGSSRQARRRCGGGA